MPYRRALITGVGGGLGIGSMIALAAWADMPLAAVPFTTSIVLVMAAPESAPAQPRAILGGHMLSALAGLIVVSLFGTATWLAAPAVGLSVAMMVLSDTLHPPAGINALLVVTAHVTWSFLLMPVAAGAVLLVGFAYVYHRIAWPGTWPSRIH